MNEGVRIACYGLSTAFLSLMFLMKNRGVDPSSASL